MDMYVSSNIANPVNGIISNVVNSSNIDMTTLNVPSLKSVDRICHHPYKNMNTTYITKNVVATIRCTILNSSVIIAVSINPVHAAFNMYDSTCDLIPSYLSSIIVDPFNHNPIDTIPKYIGHMPAVIGSTPNLDSAFVYMLQSSTTIPAINGIDSASTNVVSIQCRFSVRMFSMSNLRINHPFSISDISSRR